jgi:hypothetical protein
LLAARRCCAYRHHRASYIGRFGPPLCGCVNLRDDEKIKRHRGYSRAKRAKNREERERKNCAFIVVFHNFRNLILTIFIFLFAILVLIAPISRSVLKIFVCTRCISLA